MTTFGGGLWSKAVLVMVKSSKEHPGTKSCEIKIELSLPYISKQAKPGKSTTVTRMKYISQYKDCKILG